MDIISPFIMKQLIIGKAYSIKLFYDQEIVEALYLQHYADLFGEEYKSVFITPDGRLFEISSVESWD